MHWLVIYTVYMFYFDNIHTIWSRAAVVYQFFTSAMQTWLYQIALTVVKWRHVSVTVSELIGNSIACVTAYLGQIVRKKTKFCVTGPFYVCVCVWRVGWWVKENPGLNDQQPFHLCDIWGTQFSRFELVHDSITRLWNELWHNNRYPVTAASIIVHHPKFLGWS